jgi:putative FmdB family regulatory protein
MPIYQFYCENCGPFEQRRSFQEAGQPLECSRCGDPAMRVFTPPSLYKTSAATRIAHARNEKSAHEPRVEHRAVSEEPSSTPHLHHHPAHQHGPKRPWMIGH